MRQGVAEDVANGESQTPKALMAAIIIMGVLIILAVFVLIGVIAYRFLHPRSDANHVLPGTGSSVAESQSLTHPLMLPLRGSEHIVTITARPDGIVAVALTGSTTGDRVVLWNPETGSAVGELDLVLPAATPGGN